MAAPAKKQARALGASGMALVGADSAYYNAAFIKAITAKNLTATIHRWVSAENGLIQKTKAGRLYDISFKPDSQTVSGEYGAAFHSDIRLSSFLNLDTGEWVSE